MNCLDTIIFSIIFTKCVSKILVTIKFQKNQKNYTLDSNYNNFVFNILIFLDLFFNILLFLLSLYRLIF